MTAKKINKKFKLLDKVVYDFYNPNKPIKVKTLNIGFTCSGAPVYECNDSIIGIVWKIQNIHEDYYEFDKYDENGDSQKQGFYVNESVFYFITGYDKPLKSYQLKKA